MKVDIGTYPKMAKTKRRVKVHIHKWDTWSVYHTLSLIIVPLLKKFRLQDKGIPGFCFIDGHTKEECDIAQKKWDDTLEAMIWSFQEIFNYEKSSPDYCEYPDKDEWRALNKAYEERLQYGLELFGKHFRNLWC